MSITLFVSYVRDLDAEMIKSCGESIFIMRKFIFFSKTMYSEVPRIRHQLAELLSQHGHSVLFFQKPLFFHQSSARLVNYKASEYVEVKQTKQLIHHQLRVTSWLVKLNSWYESRQIASVMGPVNDDDIIVNFNYDYVFLRNVFKNNKIITLINDDFVAQSKVGGGKHVLRSLREVSGFSDAVLAVSYPLLEQVRAYCDRAELFLPWTERRYVTPAQVERDSILIWASVNRIIDFQLVESVLSSFPQYKVFLVGPLDIKVADEVRALTASHSNLQYLEPCALADLNNIANFFAGLMPYKAGVKSTEAVTAANKTFRLMSLGFPLVVHGMPNFLEHDAIFKCSSIDDVAGSLKYCHDHFYEMQESIESLLNKQQPFNRYEHIVSLIEGRSDV